MRAYAVLAALAAVAAAETTLFIPGFDPQQITADVEGVDASGHTTYRFGPGLTSGTFTEVPGIEGSATLVAGTTDAHVVWNNPELGISISEDCGISGSTALCTVVAFAEGSLQSDTVTEPASGFVVQGNAATPTPTGAPSSSSTGTTPSAGSALTSGPSATSSGASPTQTGKDNSVTAMGSSMVLSLGVAGLVSAFFL